LILPSVDLAIDVLKILYGRLSKAFAKENIYLTALSHHPVGYDFFAPRGSRRYDYWKWALQVMSTYGPDINISYPKEISERIFGDLEDFHRKINYYSPALVALTLASPFYKGGLKKDLFGNYYRSIRTYKRSIFAPAIETHQDENNRIEYKFFEMSNRPVDFYCFFLFCLGITLCEDLTGRATEQDRTYELGKISLEGLHGKYLDIKLEEIFSKIPPVLKQFGFDPTPLKLMKARYKKRETPADKMIDHFLSNGEYKSILLERSAPKEDS
jgi:hypothetical protein